MYKEGKLTNQRGEQLATHTWSPSAGSAAGLVFLAHGFSEHLGQYHEVAQHLCENQFYVFGHDHIGHGKSDGKRAYIESVDHFTEDVIQHCTLIKEEHPTLKMFIVGHSMGGMITIRAALKHKEFFDGIVLNGPLIIPGPQILGMDLRSTPLKTFIGRSVLGLLSWVMPEQTLGGGDLNRVTRDQEMVETLSKDELRWTGGCKVRLLLAFVDCLQDNINQLQELRTPFLCVQGSADVLCNPSGSKLLYSESLAEDKEIKIFEASKHQLFFEIKDVRTEVFGDVSRWLTKRI